MSEYEQSWTEIFWIPVFFFVIIACIIIFIFYPVFYLIKIISDKFEQN